MNDFQWFKNDEMCIFFQYVPHLCFSSATYIKKDYEFSPIAIHGN